MSSFSEVIGRWCGPDWEGGAPTESSRASDTDMHMEDDSEEGNHPQESPHGRSPNESGDSLVDDSNAGTGETEDGTIPLHVSQILNSAFKVNVSLSLTGDEPVLVGNGLSCLRCSLEFAKDIKAENERGDGCRWVVNQTKTPRRTVPLVQYPRQDSSRALQVAPSD
jgi:hypothetical protein